jgi:putative MATE family efflux protein
MTRHPLRISFSRDRDYYRSLVRIALPISGQGLISAGLNLADSVLVGRLGSNEIAAVGLANAIYFFLAVLLFGISSGLTVFVAQYWGKKDLAGVHRATGLGLLLSAGLSLFFAVVTAAIPSEMMRIFTNDPAVVALGAVFLRRIAFSYPLTALSFMFYGAMRSTGHAVAPLVSSSIALVLNTLLNLLLIYGLLGAPRMGVLGSATATLVSRVVEIAITLWIVYGRRLPSAVAWRDIVRVDPRFLAAAVKISVPVMLNEGLWVLGYTVYPAVYARMGTEVVAAFTVFSTIDRIAIVLAVGMGNAAAAIVGKEIGAGRKDLAYRYGGLSILIAPLTSVAIGLVIFLVRFDVLRLFKLSGTVLDNALLLVALGSATLWIKSFNMTAVVGVLRAGGDTPVAMLLDLVPMWTVAVPLAVCGGLFFGWPLLLVFLATVVDEAIKLAVCLLRFLSRKWIHDLVNAPESLPDIASDDRPASP